MEKLYERARDIRARIVLPESDDPRMHEAAARAAADGLAEIVFVEGQGPAPKGFEVLSPRDSRLAEELAQTYRDRRAPRDVSAEEVARVIADPLHVASLVVGAGRAGGTLAGAVSPTPDVVRAALRGIGPRPGIKTVSSFFKMILPETAHGPARPVIFSDCGMVVDPDANQLVDIASAAAESCRLLIGDEPRIAMLSFSTVGSAAHPHVSKVATATQALKQSAPTLLIDGEVQFDAAFVPEVARAKHPESQIAGNANVFVFPTLDAGNIGYKIAQRIGGATALGPVLQGLARPANDLSRGCSAQDIYDMIAITAIQSHSAD
jgi:phosphate acetyltransferase